MRSGVLFVNNIFVVAKINDQYVPLKINGCLNVTKMNVKHGSYLCFF